MSYPLYNQQQSENRQEMLGTTGTRMEADELRSKSPDEVVAELKRIEKEIYDGIPRSQDQVRSGVPLLDWLVDQVLFVVSAWEQLGRTPSDLWLLEMLALPECLRLARRKWQRAALIEHALVKDNLCWHDILRCRRKKDADGIEIWPRSQLEFIPQRLGPYKAQAHAPREFLLKPTYRADLSLAMVQAAFASEHHPLLAPIQSLKEKLGCFRIEITIGTPAKEKSNYTVFLDLPRENDPTGACAALQGTVDLIDKNLELWGSRTAKQEIGPNEAQNPEPGRSGGSIEKRLIALLRCWKKTIPKDIKRLMRSRRRRSGTTRILQKYLGIPGSIYLTPIRVLPIDCPADLLPLILGSWLFELMTHREKRKYSKHFFRGLLLLSSARKVRVDDPEVNPDKVKKMVSHLIKKLQGFNRPFSGESVEQYLLQSLRRAQYADWNLRYLDPNALEDSQDESMSMDRELPSVPSRTRRRRAERGAIKELAERLGISRKTVVRKYDQYCHSRNLPPCPSTWKRFKRWALYGKEGTQLRKSVRQRGRITAENPDGMET